MKRILTVIALLVTCLNLLLAQQNSQLRKLQLALYAITNLYVDSVDDKHLAEVAIQRMLSDLDPHSTYTNPQETKELNEPLKGGFEGIGVQFQMVDDTLVIIQPVSGGPSEKVGIIAGDRIIAVNDTAIAGVKMKTEEIMSRLRGPKGTKVNLSILRQNIKDPLRFTVTRDKIPLFSIDAAYMARPTTGYIKINRFSATTPEETAEALKNLRKQGINDGYLAPYRVIRVFFDKDVEGFVPYTGQTDDNGEVIDDRIYNALDFDRNIVLDQRTKLVAKTVSDHLKKHNCRMDKTIFFPNCV